MLKNPMLSGSSVEILVLLGQVHLHLPLPHCPVSNRDVNIGNIGPTLNRAVGTPPPLIRTQAYTAASSTPRSSSAQSLPSVDTPFWMAFIFGNISCCNGCKGRFFRVTTRTFCLCLMIIIVFGHKEFVLFQNPQSGKFEQSKERRNVYYHPWKTCIAPHFWDFNTEQHILISQSVCDKLQSEHKLLLHSEFGLAL